MPRARDARESCGHAPARAVGSRERRALALSALGIAATATLALAWADVLSGGWRLRGLFEPHAIRERRESELHFAERVAEFRREAPHERRDAVVFVGSSTIERCDFERVFPGVRALNRGIGWARARDLAARVDLLFEGVEPGAIVLYAGGPDRVADPTAVDEVVASIDVLARAVRERAPRTPVLVLGLLPSTRTRGPEADALRRIDEGVARIARELAFEHVSLRDSRLAGPDGALVETLSTDGLHLTAEGYALFADRLRAAPGPFARLLSG